MRILYAYIIVMYFLYSMRTLYVCIIVMYILDVYVIAHISIYMHAYVLLIYM